ncbi:hypothetical protein J4449_04215, partial [Candidatus Woesearchaeota archaeon]|nr:hypothetical protein [Candidatus Woesearchaeota archaeon]
MKKRNKLKKSIDKLGKENISRIISLLFLVLFSLTYFYLDAAITGFSVLDSAVIFESNNTIILDQNISSLRLSGTLEGNGSAKVYLNNYLVLDTELLGLSQNRIISQTGENLNNTTSDIFSIQPVSKNSSFEFSDICIETCQNIEAVNSSLIIEINGDLILTISEFNYTLISPELSQIVEENKSEKHEQTEKEELIQLKAEINKPVEWKLITKNKSIELPLESINI